MKYRYFTLNIAKGIKCYLAALFLLAMSGCQRMEASEYGVVFSKLPWFLAGGIKGKVLQPGEMEFLWPWDELYRVDTSVQTIIWGDGNKAANEATDGYVETRSVDGNEVGLSLTIQYHVDPKRVSYVIQNVAYDQQRIENLVEAVARTDIRSHMNILKTSDFFDPDDRQLAIDRVKVALATRLEPEGIIIDAVSYKDHRFERRLPDGSVDRSYQEQIDRTQAMSQETEQEAKKVKTVIEKKKQELNDTQAKVNRSFEEASGYKRQAMLRGDAYLEAKRNQAEQITTVGMAEVEGLKKQIAALAGPGGEALLKMTLMKELLANAPNFVVMNSPKGRGMGLDLNQIDTNELLKQAGVFPEKLPLEETKEEKKSAPVKNIIKNPPPLRPLPENSISEKTMQNNP